MLRVLRSRQPRSKRCINQLGKKLGKWFFAFACEPVNKNRRFIGVVHGRSNNQRNLWRAPLQLRRCCISKTVPPEPPRFFFSLPLSLSLSRKVTREKFYELCSTRFFFFISFQFRVTRPRERKYGETLIYINILIRETETPV